MRVFLETDDHILGAYWSDSPRLKIPQWIQATWPKYTPFYNGNCKSEMDLIYDIEKIRA